MTGVWDEVVGQADAVAELATAAEDPSAMTHAWLFTGPPGSGRSVAARAFAAALQCPTLPSGEAPRRDRRVPRESASLAVAGARGCGECPSCHTAMAGTHTDIREVVPEGLSIGVNEMRALVQLAARQPAVGRYQIVIITDADRLTEGASNALLKAVEEPSDQTVFLLCAPSEHPDDVAATIRSRCRRVALRSPAAEAVATVLTVRDGIDLETAQWAASVCGGHIGRARHLARDAEARGRRERVLTVPLGLRGLGDAFGIAAELDRAAMAEADDLSGERDAVEREELGIAMGAGGVGKGVAAAARRAKAAEKDLEKRQKVRNTRNRRDVLDLALIDLAGFYRDVLVAGAGAQVALTSPDRAGDVHRAAREWAPESALRRLEAVLACREALDRNVKPLIALEAMLVALHRG
jgi:DNA polymerase III subunit delta'